MYLTQAHTIGTALASPCQGMTQERVQELLTLESEAPEFVLKIAGVDLEDVARASTSYPDGTQASGPDDPGTIVTVDIPATNDSPAQHLRLHSHYLRLRRSDEGDAPSDVRSLSETWWLAGKKRSEAHTHNLVKLSQLLVIDNEAAWSRLGSIVTSIQLAQAHPEWVV